MHFTREQTAELNVLIQFNLDSTMNGIKVHSTAAPEMLEAVERLYRKGMVSSLDGGYLTGLGFTAAEHAQTLRVLLASTEEGA